MYRAEMAFLATPGRKRDASAMQSRYNCSRTSNSTNYQDVKKVWITVNGTVQGRLSWARPAPGGVFFGRGVVTLMRDHHVRTDP